MLSSTQLNDQIALKMVRAREMGEDAGLTGFGVVTLWTPKDGVKQQFLFTNLITTVGDEYYAKRAIQGIAPNSYSYSTEVDGMKLGTGATAVAKSSTGAAIITYISSSNNAFDTGHPNAAAVTGTNTGWYAVYQTTWPAADSTNSAIVEASIVTDRASNNSDGSAAAATISRVVFSAVNKTAADALTITWNHKFLGAST